jgi:hypothetical protein
LETFLLSSSDGIHVFQADCRSLFGIATIAGFLFAEKIK